MPKMKGYTTHRGPILTQFDYDVCPVPGPQESKGGSFGKAISEGPGPTKGIMGEVQYSELHRGKGGGKVSGS